MANQHGNGRDEHRTEREIERHGGGQSGYGAGRLGDDRAMGPGYRNQTGYTRDNDDDREGVRTDDRFTGRGGEGYWRESTERSDYNSGYNRGGMGYGMDGEGMPPRSRSQQNPGRTGQYPDRYGPNYGGNWEEQGRGTKVSHRGKGPVGYTRSDDRIREAVCEALFDDHNVDASHIEVVVKNGEVLLTGSVDDRAQKRMAEDVALNQAGVQDVQNQLRVGGNRTSDSAVGKNETVTSTSFDNKPRA